MFWSSILLLAVASLASAQVLGNNFGKNLAHCKSVEELASCVAPATIAQGCTAGGVECACSVYDLTMNCYTSYCPDALSNLPTQYEETCKGKGAPKTATSDSPASATASATITKDSSATSSASANSAAQAGSGSGSTASGAATATATGSKGSKGGSTSSSATGSAASATASKKPNAGGRSAAVEAGALFAVAVVVAAGAFL